MSAPWTLTTWTASPRKHNNWAAQVALPKMPIPGVGWLAYMKDTEGNVFGMMQADANAK